MASLKLKHTSILLILTLALLAVATCNHGDPAAKRELEQQRLKVDTTGRDMLRP